MEPAHAELNLPRPVGFVLGGGGSLGAVQVGMLEALTDQQVIPLTIVKTVLRRQLANH